MIIVGGESLMDLIAYPGGRLVAISGGGPFNTARTIARLGGSAAYLGRLSTDRFGRELLERLVLDGVDCRLVQRTDEPTTLAVADIDESGAATYRFYLEGTSAPGLSADGQAGGLLDGARALHVGTLGLVLEPMGTTLESLVRQGLRRSSSRMAAVRFASSSALRRLSCRFRVSTSSIPSEQATHSVAHFSASGSNEGWSGPTWPIPRASVRQSSSRSGSPARHAAEPARSHRPRPRWSEPPE